jgi:hypothetical protein
MGVQVQVQVQVQTLSAQSLRNFSLCVTMQSGECVPANRRPKMWDMQRLYAWRATRVQDRR